MLAADVGNTDTDRTCGVEQDLDGTEEQHTSQTRQQNHAPQDTSASNTSQLV